MSDDLRTRARDDVGSAIAEAVRDYQTVFPVPYKLSPNLRLAVDALAERDRAEATIARVRALVADTGNTSTGPTYALCADVLAAIERTDS